MKTNASVVMQPVMNIEETSWQDNIWQEGKSLIILS